MMVPARLSAPRPRHIARLSGLALAAAIVAATAAVPEASAQTASPNVAVPSQPHVALPRRGVAGCWVANQLIYGPYAVSFCSDGRAGSYRVTGGGLSCGGAVNISRRGGALRVQLGHGRCNRRTDWTADTLVCSRVGGYGGGHGRVPDVAAPAVPVPGVPVPGVPVPGFGQLTCTYYPAVAGYSPVGVSFRRY